MEQIARQYGTVSEPQPVGESPMSDRQIRTGDQVFTPIRSGEQLKNPMRRALKQAQRTLGLSPKELKRFKRRLRQVRPEE